MVIDGDVHEFPADSAHPLGAIAGDAWPHTDEAREFLDVSAEWCAIAPPGAGVPFTEPLVPYRLRVEHVA